MKKIRKFYRNFRDWFRPNKNSNSGGYQSFQVTGMRAYKSRFSPFGYQQEFFQMAYIQPYPLTQINSNKGLFNSINRVIHEIRPKVSGKKKRIKIK